MSHFFECVLLRDGFACIDLKREPSSALAAENMTVLMSRVRLRTAPLSLGLAVLANMKKCPPAQLRALGFAQVGCIAVHY